MNLKLRRRKSFRRFAPFTEKMREKETQNLLVQAEKRILEPGKGKTADRGHVRI